MYPNWNLSVLFKDVITLHNPAHYVPRGETLLIGRDMGAKDRLETSRTSCDCGKGHFVFYSCSAERWLYVDNPIEKWFEMHIFCEICAYKLHKFRPTIFSKGEEQECWKIVISEPNRVPAH